MSWGWKSRQSPCWLPQTSGGSNWIDYLITKDNRTLSLAYDFAVAGATVDSTLVAPYQSAVKSLVQQVVYFKGHYSANPAIWNGTNSLFPIWFGINDIMNGYFAAPANWTTLAPLIAKQYFTQAQALYDLGARRILFLTVPPIQKTPKILAWNATAQAQLVYAVESFDCLLKAGYEDFRRNKSESTTKTWLFNTTGVFNTVLADPVAYGAKDASCYSGNGVSCLWWNDFHPGQAIHNLLAGTIANLTRF